jgi:WSC domain
MHLALNLPGFTTPVPIPISTVESALSTSGKTPSITTTSTGSSNITLSQSSILPSPSLSTSGYHFLGCYTEGSGVRALGGSSLVNYNIMTIELCANFCTPAYNMYGLEYGGECWCGNNIGFGSNLAPLTDCNMACGGNRSELCGAGNRLNIYANAAASTSVIPAPTATSLTPTPTIVASAGYYSYFGCYSEGTSSRALAAAVQVNYTTMTIEKCANFCYASYYDYFGVEFGGECYCGSSFSAGSRRFVDAVCTMPCGGAATEICGAGGYLSTYLRLGI